MKKSVITALAAALALVATVSVNGGVNFRVIHEFDGVNGWNAPGHLIHHGGRLYGMTAGDTAGNHGVIFSLLPDGSDFTLLHRFTGQPADGAWPHGSLNFFNDRIYGLTWAGGCDDGSCPENLDSNGCGVAFSLQPGGDDYTVLWQFACGEADLNASLPNASFISDGVKLYSTTQTGGEHDSGTVFSIYPDGSGFTVLHSFNKFQTEGRYPAAGLALVGETLYGTTSMTGLSGDCRGTIFSLRTDGSDFTILHTFDETDGYMPFSAPIVVAGRIFGATAHRVYPDVLPGGVFSLNLDGTDYRVLHQFSAEDGSPMEGVIMAGSTLYGATIDDDATSGVIYSVNADGSDYTVLHRFSGADGRGVYGKLLLLGNTFYGMTVTGGADDRGVIFSFQRPVPENPVLQSGDYNGDGKSDLAVFRPGSGLWAVRGLGRVYFGGPGDIPVSGDYTGDGVADIGIFRPASGLWAIKNVTRLYFGGPDDLPAPADYDGDGRAEIAVFHSQAGRWAVRGLTSFYFGALGDRPVPGDYSGDGTSEAAVFRPGRPAPLPENPNHFDLPAHHVRYKLGLFNWKENPDFEFWTEAGGKESSRERIWISEVWKPEPNEIRNVVFISAGQQGAQHTWSAEANIATGQSEGWRGAKEALTHTIPIRRLSVAGLIYEDGVYHNGELYQFSPHDTLFILVFDAAFYYGLNPGNKQKLEDGYYNYLIDRMGPRPGNVETIFMAGASRGGALVFRLAKRFMDGSSPVSGARILLATLDAVAHQGQGECGTSTATVTNPLNSGYRAYQAKLSEFLGDPTPEQLGVYQVIGGAKVVFLDVINPARSFINYGPSTFDYSFDWVNRGHTEIGRPWQDDCSGALLDWLAGKRLPGGAPGTRGGWRDSGRAGNRAAPAGTKPDPDLGATRRGNPGSSSGLWAVRGVTRLYFGTFGDRPLPAVYQWYGGGGPFRTGIGIFRPSTGFWAIRGAGRGYFGREGDIPFTGDFTGNSLDEIGVFRPETGLWAVRGITRAYFGAPGDRPVTR